jgi:hypothetical protein
MKYINGTCFVVLECAIKTSVKQAATEYAGCIMVVERESMDVTEESIQRLLDSITDHSIIYRESCNDMWIGSGQQLWCTKLADKISSQEHFGEIISTSKHTSATWQCTNDPSWWGEKNPELGPCDIVWYGSWCGHGCTDQMHIVRLSSAELRLMHEKIGWPHGF